MWLLYIIYINIIYFARFVIILMIYSVADVSAPRDVFAAFVPHAAKERDRSPPPKCPPFFTKIQTENDVFPRVIPT